MFEMDDLPLKPAPTPAAPVRKRTPAKRKSPTRQAQTVKASARPKRQFPPVRLPGEEQPRDRFGRFARKTGAVLWSATKATGRAVAGTVKTVRKAHKTVKRVQSSARKRANLEARERRIALAEREKKLGIRKKVRRRKRV